MEFDWQPHHIYILVVPSEDWVGGKHSLHESYRKNKSLDETAQTQKNTEQLAASQTRSE